MSLCGLALFATGSVATGLNGSALRPTLGEPAAAEDATAPDGQRQGHHVVRRGSAPPMSEVVIPTGAPHVPQHSSRTVPSRVTRTDSGRTPMIGAAPEVSSRFIERPADPGPTTTTTTTTVPVPKLTSLTGGLSGGSVIWDQFACPEGYTGARRAVLQVSRPPHPAMLILEVCETRGGRGGAPAGGSFEIATEIGSVVGSVTGSWTWKDTDVLRAQLTITSGTGAYRNLRGELSLLAELGDTSTGELQVAAGI
jgi:hypothetical protein